MKTNIDILVPEIFPKDKILSGVTKKNDELFPPFGLSISNGDILNDEEVLSHRTILAEFLGYNIENLKFQKQIHSDKIQIVDKNTPNNLETDGMFTTEKGLVLNISIADCTGILIYDPINEVIAAVHSGWKGTQQNITKIAINKLSESYHSNPKDLLVYLSPSAGGSNYEVRWDVAQYFPNSITQINETKYLYDNKKQIVLQLEECAVDKNNIEISDICTIDDKCFHSFRRDKSKSGRMSAFIAMK